MAGGPWDREPDGFGCDYSEVVDHTSHGCELPAVARVRVKWPGQDNWDSRCDAHLAALQGDDSEAYAFSVEWRVVDGTWLAVDEPVVLVPSRRQRGQK